MSSNPQALPAVPQGRTKFRTRSVALLSVAVLVAGWVALNIVHLYQERRLVSAWTTGDRWDANLSWRANQERRVKWLRTNAPVTVKVFRQQLKHEAFSSRLRGKLPDRVLDWVERWSGPGHPAARQHEAAQALVLLGPDAREALPDLLRRTNSQDWVLYPIALAIGSIGEDTSQVRAALEGILNRSSRQTAACAAFSLWRLAPDDLPSQQQLEKLIDEGALVCLNQPLAELGSDAIPLAPVIRQAFDNTKRVQNRLNIAYTLWRITGDPETALAAIKSLAEDHQEPKNLHIDRLAKGRAADGLGSAALVFQEIPECRAALRPILTNFVNSRGDYFLAEFAKIEREHGSSR